MTAPSADGGRLRRAPARRHPPIGTDTTAPFSVIWRASNLSGTHTLTAKAFDAAGNFATSAAIMTTVTRSARGPERPAHVGNFPLPLQR
jgi:hypothetical protein